MKKSLYSCTSDLWRVTRLQSIFDVRSHVANHSRLPSNNAIFHKEDQQPFIVALPCLCHLLKEDFIKTAKVRCEGAHPFLAL